MSTESLTARNGGRTGLISFSNLRIAEIQDILQDPATSYWVVNAYRELLQRDPLDALNDADFLYQAMCARFVELKI